MRDRDVREHSMTMPQENVYLLLSGGDKRSIGRVDDVVSRVCAGTVAFADLYRASQAEDECVVMRAWDAIEKINRVSPEYLIPYKRALLTQVSEAQRKEIRWHLAQIISNLIMSESEKREAFQTLLVYLSDQSSIVVSMTLSALYQLSQAQPDLRRILVTHLNALLIIGKPAVKVRARQ